MSRVARPTPTDAPDAVAHDAVAHDGGAHDGGAHDGGRGGRVLGVGRSLAGLMRTLGPGLITGAADDDPSGISTYSQAGAAFGYATLWVAVVSFPLMAAVQLMCARIGFVARRGLASVLREHYPRPVLWAACALLLVANTLNIAADLGGMAAGARLLTGWPAAVFVPVFAVAIVALLVFASYVWVARVFKWLTLVLFAYVLTAFLAHPDWRAVLRGTVVPHLGASSAYLLTLVALLGTTISPYLFFWQASQEAEEVAARDRTRALGTRVQRPRAAWRALRALRLDVLLGMFASNLIMYFIILTAGATLHVAGLTNVQTAEQAATALRPLAGPAASLLFTLGLVGTGMLGVPVLAGSGAYALAEAAAWRSGMDETPDTAPQFYGIIALSVGLGTALTFARVDAIRLLFWSAVVNGVFAPPLIVLVLVVCNNRRVMRDDANGVWLNTLGGLAALAMAAAAVALLVSLLR